MTCRWWMFVKSLLYPKRSAFFLQFLLFCSCCGTLAGRSWRRHGLTLNMFCQALHTSLILSVSVSRPRCAEVARSRTGDRSSQNPPSSTRSGVRAAFSALWGEPIGRSSMTAASLLRETEPCFFSPSLSSFVSWVCGARGAPPARLRRNFEWGRTQSAAKSAQTDRRGGGCSI